MQTKCKHQSFDNINENFFDKPKKNDKNRRKSCDNIPKQTSTKVQSFLKKFKTKNRKKSISEETPKPYNVFHKEEYRLKSYKNWPNKKVKPEQLSQAGFYFTHLKDRVRCAYCELEVEDWLEDDDPLLLHVMYNGTCPYVKAIVGEIGGCVVRKKEASFPQFGSHLSRIASFKDWPVSLKEKPTALADAGMFYTGRSDKTVCFFCATALKDWEKDDNPWEQHALYSPNCEYVLLCKGETFVENVKHTTDTNNNARHPIFEKDGPVTKTDEVDGDHTNIMLCKICTDQEMSVLFFPCRHLVSCVDCAFKVHSCPICRQGITSLCKVYIS